MTVRAKIALTIVLTGLLTALGVVIALLLAYQRFEHESSYYRAQAFLERVNTQHSDLLGLRERIGDDFTPLLANLVLYEPNTQLYLLNPDGQVLSSTGPTRLSPNFRVPMGPVMLASGDAAMPYVMGNDPERMASRRVVVAARALRRPAIAPNPPNPPVAAYLYLVTRPRALSATPGAAWSSALLQPFVLMVLAVVALSTGLAAWITASVTRPLTRLTQAVNTIREQGLGEPVASPSNDQAFTWHLPDTREPNEFGQLARGIDAMLQTLKRQWAALRRLDHFRREGVSNLSHDLRSPLTATTACLETLESRWADDAERDADRALVGVALRNARNAARLVQSLGDLARLDEPAFQISPEVLDLGELLDDLAMRFADRAQQLGVVVQSAEPSADTATRDAMPVLAAVDVQLIERAVANLVDNALKFSTPGSTITLQAQRREGSPTSACITVSDQGAGIAPADLPHLFDRFYQSRHQAAPATGEGGKGLGLAIVKRIAELHGGELSVASAPGQGTVVTLTLPAAA
jgi:signal transduction histidine kinase